VWTTYDLPDRQVAVARWELRDLSVVFPLGWARRYGQTAMIARAQVRVFQVEAMAQKHLVGGSVLLGFARRDESLDLRVAYAPEVLAYGL